jgi:hypothetical protein
MTSLTTCAFEQTSSRVTIYMDVVTAPEIVADSADVTPEGYRLDVVKKVVKARAARPVRTGMSASELNAWLND